MAKNLHSAPSAAFCVKSALMGDRCNMQKAPDGADFLVFPRIFSNERQNQREHSNSFPYCIGQSNKEVSWRNKDVTQ